MSSIVMEPAHLIRRTRIKFQGKLLPKGQCQTFSMAILQVLRILESLLKYYFRPKILF
jgi:hypothetical protein